MSSDAKAEVQSNFALTASEIDAIKLWIAESVPADAAASTSEKIITALQNVLPSLLCVVAGERGCSGMLWTGNTGLYTAHLTNDPLACAVASATFDVLLPRPVKQHQGFSVLPQLGAKQAADLAYVELNTDGIRRQLPLLGGMGHGLIGLTRRKSQLKEAIFVAQMVLSSEARDEHQQHGSLILRDCIAVSLGQVCESLDKDFGEHLLSHTAFTTGGSCGGPVVAVSDCALLGMSFMRDSKAGISYAERASEIARVLKAGVPYIAETRVADQIRAGNVNRLLLAMDSGRHGADAKLSDIIRKQEEIADSCASSATHQYNSDIRSRAFSSLEDLIDKVVRSDRIPGVTKAFNALLGRIIFDHLLQQAERPLLGDPKLEHDAPLRFDKQSNPGVFAIQPNGGELKGKCYASVTLSADLRAYIADERRTAEQKAELVELMRWWLQISRATVDSIKKSQSDVTKDLKAMRAEQATKTATQSSYNFVPTKAKPDAGDAKHAVSADCTLFERHEMPKPLAGKCFLLSDKLSKDDVANVKALLLELGATVQERGDKTTTHYIRPGNAQPEMATFEKVGAKVRLLSLEWFWKNCQKADLL